MEIEQIIFHEHETHITHYRASGRDKIDFDARGGEKLVKTLKYLNEYCSENNMIIQTAYRTDKGTSYWILVSN
ncbi:MAG: hypothetical protein ACW99A_18885 [Candidatus Kariarchaeaceae archaeon]|jgi:hypothetical protein